MEYRIFKYIRGFNIPGIIRIPLGVIVIIFGVVFGTLPLIPGIPLILLGCFLVFPGRSVTYIVKIRKNIFHMFKNFNKWHIIKQKFYDLGSIIRKVIRRK